jgi:hypothetical protein
VAASRQGKSVGQAIAITTLTPIRDLRKLRRRLRIVRYGPAFGRPLERLAFIYFARWTVIDRLPPAQPLHTPYLLFESNFDGGLVAYLDAFADRLPTRIAALWQTCYGFAEDVMERARGKRFPPGDFKRFVAKNELRVLHFYAAYPDATTLTVRQAIALADRLDRKRGSVDATAAALAFGPAPEERAWPGRLRRTIAAWWQNVTGRYRVSPLTLALPLEPASADELVARLDQLDQQDSPLAGVPGTHFARFVLIEPELIDLGQPQPDVLQRPYLLFTSNHDGTREDYLRALAPAADWVWRACADPADGDAAEWLAAHAIDTRYFVTGFPARKVDAVRDALARRGGVQREALAR